MKIAFYGLWQDELKKLKELTEQLSLDVVLATEKDLNAETVALSKGAEGVSVLGRGRIGEDIVKSLAENGVKFLATRSIGYNHIDLTALKKYGLKLCNSQYPPDSVAEFTVMLILNVLRRYKQVLWRQQVNDYALSGLKGNVLGARTVGVIGGGRIGKKVMRILNGFGCKILYASEFEDEEVKDFATFTDKEEIYEKADIITYHVPLNNQTKKMLNRETLSKMKDGVVLINTARGELFDVNALIEGIESQKIGALAMDVFDGEEGIYHLDRTDDILQNREMAYLRQFPNVVLTPHMAFYTQMSMDAMIQNSVEGLLEFQKTGTSRLEIKL